MPPWPSYTGGVTTRRLAALGAFAAVAASAGDLLMLWVGNARRPELGLPAPPDTVLWLGCALGVAGIPLYALGYQGAAGLLRPAHPRAAHTVISAGAFAAGIGAAIHGTTAALIASALRSNAQAAPPLEAVAESPLLVALWLAAALAVVVASAVFAWCRRRDPALALANPALVTVALALLAAPSEWLRSFLAPAAPNLAHVVFFLVCARR